MKYTKHQWESRTYGTKLAVISSILWLLYDLVFNEFSPLFLTPIAIWILIILVVYILGFIIKRIINLFNGKN